MADSINTFEKGLDRDSSNHNKPKGTYEYAENFINNSEKGKYSLANEAGITKTNTGLIDEDPLHWITIGSVNIDNIEILFQGFISDHTVPNPIFTNSRISLKNLLTGVFTVAYVNHDKLNFNIDYHINNPQVKKMYNGDINVYFTDNYNSVKFVRLIYQSDTSSSPYIVEQEVSNLNLDFEEPIIDYTSQLDSGGQAPLGTIHFFIQYLDKYGNSTRFSNLTNGIPVINTIRNTQHSSIYLTDYSGSTSNEKKIPFGKVTAGNQGDVSTKQIKLTINHLDTSYSYIKLGYMYYKDNVYTPTYKLIDRLYPISSSPSLHIDNYTLDISFYEPTVPLDENQVTQIAKKFEYTHAKCMSQHQNYLILGNLKNKYEALSNNVYEEIANNIVVKTAIKTLTTNLDAYNSQDLNKSFDHEQSNFRYKSYKRAEIYSLGIRFIYKGGYKTKVYHIPAPERVTEYNSGLMYNFPVDGSNLTGTFYSSETYKTDSKYINSSNNIANIRHHVMPNFYHNDGISSTYRLSNSSFIDGETNTVNTLGLYFENININTLPDSFKEDIVGIEFVRQTREDAQNKRIICQGINRSIQRPLSRSSNYPVVVDPSSGLAVPLNTAPNAKTYPFALQSSYQPYISTEVNVSPNDGNHPWDVKIDTDSYFHNDGLNAYVTGKYGGIGKKCTLEGWIDNTTNSVTAPLDTFGHINNVIMPNTGSPSVVTYTSYDEFIFNIISPETEFNLIPLISSYKLDLRDRLHFRTYDVYENNDSAGNKGSLIPINNSIGDKDYNNFVFGTRGGGSLRSVDDGSYQYSSVVGVEKFRTKLLQYSSISYNTVLIAEPLISQTVENFNTSLLSSPLLTVKSSTNNGLLTQDIIDIQSLGFKINDTFSNNNVDIDFIIKHCYMNNGLYLVPNDSVVSELTPILKAYTNNNLRHEIRFINNDPYFAEQGIYNTNIDFGSIPAWQRIFRKDKIDSVSTVKAYSSCSDIEKLDVDYSSTLIFDVISDIKNQYGSIYNAEYFPIHVDYNIDKNLPTTIGNYTNPIFSGDTFICWYGNNNGGYGENYGLKEGVSSGTIHSGAFDDNWLLHKVHTYNNNIIYFPVETSVNTYFRSLPSDGVNYFPNTTLKDSFEDTNNIYKRSPHFNSDAYNLSYSFNQNNINLSTTENQLTGLNGSFGKYPNRIIYSNQSVDGEIDDQYRVFLTQNFRDIPKDTGEIWNMWQFNNDIYAHTENALFKTYMQPNAVLTTTAGDEAVLGSGNLFSNPPQKILTKEGYSGGTKSAWGYMITPYGLIFVDNNGKKIYRLLNDQLEELSFNGMMNFFNMYSGFITTRGDYRLDTHYKDDTPYNPKGHGWHFGYDDFNKRVLITKRSGIFSTTESLNETKSLDIRRPERFFKEFTISYSFLTNSFLGFSSYIPLYYINISNYLVSIPDPNDIVIDDLNSINTNHIATHNDFTNPCRFYKGIPEDSILKYTINEFPQIEKVFDNISLDMYNYSNLINLGTLLGIADRTIIPLRAKDSLIYDTLEVESSNQYSGKRELHYTTNTSEMFTYFLDKKLGVKYKNKEYKMVVPKSRTINKFIDPDYALNYSNGDIDYNQVGDRFKDKYFQVTFTFKNYERWLLIINFIKNIFRVNK